MAKPAHIYDWPVPPPGETDSDADSDEPLIPSLANRIPLYCRKAPEIPPGRFEWKCPGCSYTINLLNITEDDIQGFPEGAAADSMRAKAWTYRDEDRVRLAFSYMVSNHYEMHMHQNGVHIVSNGQEVRDMTLSICLIINHFNLEPY